MSVGRSLAAARQRAGLSLETVADRTRIRRTVVAAIEKDDFSHCMGDVYARGHIRSIARVVGADAEVMLAEFDAQVPHMASNLLPSDDVVLTGGLEGTPRKLNWSAVLVACLVAVLCWTAWSAVRPSSDPGDDPSVPLARATTAATTPSPKPAAPKPAPKPTRTPDAVAQAPRSGVSVNLRAADGASWVRATSASGATLFEGIVAAGTTEQFTDRARVKLVIGNAGAVTLTVNGKKIGSPGDMGQVASVEFTPQDPL